jgi:putative membrane protein
VDRRFPRWVYGHGTEPDARFSLANERTFLAWTRTALALLAGGVALEVLGLGIAAPFRLAASLVLIGTGVLTPLQAWFGWGRAERSLRQGGPLPSAMLAGPIAGAVSMVGALVFLGVVLR